MTDEQQDMLNDISVADMCSVISSREQAYKDEIRRLKKGLLSSIKDNKDKRLEPILKMLKDLGVIASWYYNGSYHAQ